MNIMHLLASWRSEHGHRPAIIACGRFSRTTISFDGLARRVAVMADKLHRSGLVPGERVLILQPMSIELYVAILGAWQAGLTVMFIDPARGRKVVAACLAGTPASAFIAPWYLRALAALLPAWRKLPGLGVVSVRAAAGTRQAEAVAREDRDAALITFTSGSTGTPAPVVRSHAFMCTQLASLNSSFALPAGSVDLVAMPMFVLPNLANGVTSLLPACQVRRPDNVDAAALLRQIVRERPHRLLASPALLDRLAKHCLAKQRTLSVGQILTGGAPAYPDMLDRIRRSAPSTRIRLVYGSSEAEPMSFIDLDELTPDDWARQRAAGALLVGRPVHSLHLRLRPLHCHPAVMPEGAMELGVVQVRGKHVLLPSHRAGNWHDTGDVACRDRGGRLWLLGRESGLVNDRYGVVFPFPATVLARSVPGVLDACLARFRDQRVMVVQADQRRPPDADLLRRRLQSLHVRYVLLCKQLPLDKRHNGKIDEPALRELLERKCRRGVMPAGVSGRQRELLVNRGSLR